jgi:hypothetical protein
MLDQTEQLCAARRAAVEEMLNKYPDLWSISDAERDLSSMSNSNITIRTGWEFTVLSEDMADGQWCIQALASQDMPLDDASTLAWAAYQLWMYNQISKMGGEDAEEGS